MNTPASESGESTTNSPAVSRTPLLTASAQFVRTVLLTARVFRYVRTRREEGYDYTLKHIVYRTVSNPIFS
jgi:hypothetical protein